MGDLLEFNQPAGHSAEAAVAARLTHLERLERRASTSCVKSSPVAENPVMLLLDRQGSSVMLRLALKAFYAAKPPFPFLHIDTTWKFAEMYEFRTRMAQEYGLDLLVHINQEGLAKGIGPFTHGSRSTPT